MGYESKLYIVEKPKNGLVDDGKTFVTPIAMYDMCKFPDLAEVLKKQPKTTCYFYADDGNTQVLVDKYDKELTESPLSFVLDLLIELYEKDDSYRRILPCIKLLEIFKEEQDKGKWQNLLVLHYGH